MRNFDLHNVFLDENGNVFSGKIYFTERDGDVSNLKPIYASNGTTKLPNPIYSTNYGTTENQVFLESGDYSVWVYRYTGSGDMTSDTSSWEKVPYSPFIVTDVTTDIALSISSLALPQIPNVAKLRTHGTDIPLTEDGKRLVALTGYNVAGDKGVSYYKYSAIGNDSDDGGSVISINGDTSHCWRLVNKSDCVDVADFGIFPGSGISSQLSSAEKYANNNGKSLKFNKGNYSIDSNLYVNADIIADGSTLTSTSSVSITCRNLICGSSCLIGSSGKIITLVSDFAKSSWAYGSSGINFNPRYRMLFDKDYAQTLNGVIVEVDGGISVTSHNWTNCTILNTDSIESNEFKSSTSSNVFNVLDSDKIKSANGANYFTEIKGEKLKVKKGTSESVIEGGGITADSISVSGQGTFGYLSVHGANFTSTGIAITSNIGFYAPAILLGTVELRGDTKISSISADSMVKYGSSYEITIDNIGAYTTIIGNGTSYHLSSSTLIIAKPSVDYPTTTKGYPRINIAGNTFADGTRLTIQYLPLGVDSGSATVDVYQTGGSGETPLFVCRIVAGQYVDLRYFNAGGAKGWLPFARFV